MYKDGGLFSVSSTILITDMLKGSVPVELITGMVVMHAERYVVSVLEDSQTVAHVNKVDSVTPTSQEAFVIRIYRQSNKVSLYPLPPIVDSCGKLTSHVVDRIP